MIEKRLPVLEPNRWIRTGSEIALVLGVLGVLAWRGLGFSPGLIGLHLLWLGALGFHVGRTQTMLPRRAARRLKISSHGILADGALLARGDQIVRGYYQPRSATTPDAEQDARKYGSTVRILGRAHRILAEIECEPEDADAILAELGLGAAQVRADFRVAAEALPIRRIGAIQTSSAIVFVALFFLMALFDFPRAAVLSAVLFSFSLILIGALWPTKLSVGVDGILLRRFGRKRFLPMARIRAVRAAGWRAIEVVLDDGRVESIKTSSTKNESFTPRVSELEHRDAVLARMNAAFAARPRRRPSPELVRTVGRGLRTHDEWLAGLRALRGSETGGYREAALREADLWDAVESPAVAEDARAGAALLLRRSMDDAGRQRVRVAAETTASPKLRIALDRAAGATSDAEVEAALADLDGPASEPLQRVRSV